MDAGNDGGSPVASGRTKVERAGDLEMVTTRTFDGPARIVFAAWTTPELMQRWWVPKSVGMSFVSCEMDARTGGRYRFVFAHPAFPEPRAFFGRYIEVLPPSRIVWTNEESGHGGAVSTLTFDEKDGRTLLTLREVYPDEAGLNEALQMGDASDEQYVQLDDLLTSLKAEGKF